MVVASLHSCLEWVEIAYNSTVYFFLNGTCFILSNPHMKKTSSDSTPVISQKNDSISQEKVWTTPAPAWSLKSSTSVEWLQSGRCFSCTYLHIFGWNPGNPKVALCGTRDCLCAKKRSTLNKSWSKSSKETQTWRHLHLLAMIIFIG